MDITQRFILENSTYGKFGMKKREAKFPRHFLVYVYKSKFVRGVTARSNLEAGAEFMLQNPGVVIVDIREAESEC